mmetsp:Transcript_17005/g.57072  ORF Transcript_17005/g.57072 Transcript_17005/m.57072 type:complete len:373 (+) Transcript_17005:430-1548(+)
MRMRRRALRASRGRGGRARRGSRSRAAARLCAAPGMVRPAARLWPAPGSADERVDHLVEHVPGLSAVGDHALPVALPPVEPRHGVVPVPLEHVPPVEHAVVVDEEHVARAHGATGDVLLRHRVDVLQVPGVQGAEVPGVDVRHADLGHRARAPVPQVARVVVHVAEPHGAARLGVPRHGRLAALDGLQPVGVAVRAVDHLEVHVELGGDDGGHEALEEVHGAILERAEGPEEVEVEVGHRDAHLAVVELLEHLRVQVPEDGRPVGDEELAALHRRGLEAHKGAIGGRLLLGGLVVKANVVLGEGLLVHLLVDRVLGGGEGAEARGVDGVQARVEPHGVVEGPEPLLVLHQVKAPEPERAVVAEETAEAVRVV